MSTTEAEYIAATSVAYQAVWLKRILTEMGMDQTKAIPITCDNNSTISIARNPIHHGRMKHIDIRFHFIRELSSDGPINLQYCSSTEWTADILTKALSIQKFNYLSGKLGVQSLRSEGCVEHG